MSLVHQNSIIPPKTFLNYCLAWKDSGFSLRGRISRLPALSNHVDIQPWSIWLLVELKMLTLVIIQELVFPSWQQPLSIQRCYCIRRHFGDFSEWEKKEYLFKNIHFMCCDVKSIKELVSNEQCILLSKAMDSTDRTWSFFCLMCVTNTCNYLLFLFFVYLDTLGGMLNSWWAKDDSPLDLMG